MTAEKPSILQKIKEEIIKQKANHKDSPIWDELFAITQSDNPLPPSAIDYIFILSARIIYLDTTLEKSDSLDLRDDYERVHLAVQTAKTITAKRLKKNIQDISKNDLILYGPNIFYIGLKIQNQALIQSMNSETIKLSDFPIEKIIILELPDMGGTKAQFICIRDKFKLADTSVAIITHAYHFPRISRMIGKEAPLHPFGNNVTCYAMLTDRQFEAPDALENIVGELERIPTYIAQRDLSFTPCYAIIS